MKTAHQLIWWASLCCQALLYMGLFRRSDRTKPMFLLWLLAALLRSLILVAIGGVGRNAYFLVYASTEPALLLLFAFAVNEAYREQARNYLDLGRVGSWLLHAGMALAAVAGAVVFASTPGAWPQAAMRALLTLRLAGLGGIVALAAVAIAVFAVWRVPGSNPWHLRFLAANAALEVTGMTAMRWLGQDAVSLVNLATLSGVAALWLAWPWATREAAGEGLRGVAAADALRAESDAAAVLDEAKRAQAAVRE